MAKKNTRRRFRKQGTKKRLIKHRKTRVRRVKKGGNQDECPVCLENKELCTMKPCNHKICEDCFKRLNIPKKCPLCRQNVDDLICNKISTENLPKPSKRIRTVEEIVRESLADSPYPRPLESNRHNRRVSYNLNNSQYYTPSSFNPPGRIVRNRPIEPDMPGTYATYIPGIGRVVRTSSNPNPTPSRNPNSTIIDRNTGNLINR